MAGWAEYKPRKKRAGYLDKPGLWVRPTTPGALFETRVVIHLYHNSYAVLLGESTMAAFPDTLTLHIPMLCTTYTYARADIDQIRVKRIFGVLASICIEHHNDNIPARMELHGDSAPLRQLLSVLKALDYPLVGNQKVIDSIPPNLQIALPEANSS
jgi:hypothetical protein